MMRWHPKYTNGIWAVALYLLVVVGIFYYFGYREHRPSVRYVAHDTGAIAVTLRSLGQQSSAQKRSSHPAKKPSPKPHKTSHKKPKPIHRPRSKKPAHPKPVPKKRAKKKATKPRKKPAKPIDTRALFSSTVSQKSAKKSSNKSTKHRTGSSRKQAGRPTAGSKTKRPGDRGIENRYLARVQDALYGWPTQSNFAGARIVLDLRIHPDGSFDYRVLRPSGNVEFDRTILRYLDRLKAQGFGPTPSGRPYHFETDILAK